MSSASRILLLCAAVVFTSAAGATGADPRIDFELYRLDNGLEVLLHEDRTLPLVAVSVWYHVGSGDEPPEKSGFAHLFEHMLFQGSKHVGEDRHFDTLRRIGGTSINGTTNSDRTNYFEIVPSHQLETALWIESDRMGYFLPLLTERSLRNQIDVVRNERRQNYDDVPYGRTRFAQAAALYPEGHPYRYLTIGRHEDLVAATLEDVRAFYERWYVPANATLALAGDFDTDSVKQVVDKWFGTFPASVRPERVTPPSPVLDERTRVEVEDELAALSRIQYAWHTPAYLAPDDAELDILAHVLAATGTGRLYRTLVHEKQLAQSVSAAQVSRRLSSYFQVTVTARRGAALDAIERLLDEELDRVRQEPISRRELDRMVTGHEASTIWRLEGLMARANMLQSYNHYTGDPGFLTRDLDRFRTTTPERVRDAAARYLSPERRAEVLTLPPSRARREAGKP